MVKYRQIFAPTHRISLLGISQRLSVRTGLLDQDPGLTNSHPRTRHSGRMTSYIVQWTPVDTDLLERQHQSQKKNFIKRQSR